MKDQIRAFILKALRAADGQPMQETVLRSAVRGAFPNVAHTEADLTLHLQYCEQQGWISGAVIDLAGTIWTLTPKGILKAGQLA